MWENISINFILLSVGYKGAKQGGQTGFWLSLMINQSILQSSKVTFVIFACDVLSQS
ncbi:hypothetical protein N481_09960 [Pseudoalteromonas luteoviolacea S4047-1]|uniref:Uncharacterized protein n=1 Tax=Pseudoalteromonas luteoviolacea S4054 TaxID=1129367 RepID=A0A0F6ADA2_9GAMM|nr:hypothetical protein N479_14525 [Pseudoalteromonas luteoviolacea S4054]KZN74029.1 hypothetical protein N481_09960 [Pseudoalteromonas luteoviolacea S4047-1]